MPELTQERYRKLQRFVEDAKAEADRRKGTFDELTRQLKEHFDCATIKEAKRKLEKLRAERDRRQAKFEAAVRRYEKQWAEKI